MRDDQFNLGDGPVESAYVQTMRHVVKSLDKRFNGNACGADRKVGFILLVFPFGEAEGRCNYMSNGANREDVLTMLKEQVARFEGQSLKAGRE